MARCPRSGLFLSPLAAAAGALALAGCASDSAVPRAAAPQVQEYTAGSEEMPGRWLLAATGSSSCAMTFGGAPGAGQGTIAPEGGCPENFFTSRKWTFEQGSLVIRDHNGAVLANLTQSAPGHFDGKSVNGIVLSLTR